MTPHEKLAARFAARHRTLPAHIYAWSWTRGLPKSWRLIRAQRFRAAMEG